jgi:hypothetical protein
MYLTYMYNEMTASGKGGIRIQELNELKTQKKLSKTFSSSKVTRIHYGLDMRYFMIL